MENQLVRTDKFVYKIKRFFRNLFWRRNSQVIIEPTEEEKQAETAEALEKIISCKTEVQEINIKEQLADKIIKNELPIKDLSEEELDQMIEYFKADIKTKEEEIKQLKKEIAELKKENKKENNNDDE